MVDFLIKHDTAKIAQSKGFDWRTSWYYFKNSEERQLDQFCRTSNYNITIDKYSAPTQSLLQKWIRDTQDLHIQICIGSTLIYPSKCWVYYIQNDKGRTIQWNTNSDEVFNSYEEALEAGLINALNLINV